MNPTHEQVFKAILASAESSTDEDAIVAALMSLGLDSAEALRAFRFTQVAWSRSILSRLPLSLSEDYILFASTGRVQDHGRLADQPWFVAACHDASMYQSSPQFQSMAVGCSEFQAVNNALNAGSQPQNLALTPVFMFPLNMTNEALAIAQQIIAGEVRQLQMRAMRDQQESQNSTKPWWKIW